LETIFIAETRYDTHEANEANAVHYVATNPKLIPKNSFVLKWACRRADVENGSQIVIDTLYWEEIVEYSITTKIRVALSDD